MDYRVIAGPLGNEKEFEELLAASKAVGIRIVVDVVLNHMANFGRDSDLVFPPRKDQEKYGLGPLFGPRHFHAPFCIGNYNDPAEVRNGRICGGGGDSGLPDLDHSHPEVLAAQKAYLKRLKAMGVGGIRIDAIKHMEPWVVPALLDDELLSDDFLVFGESIADVHSYQRDLVPYLEAGPEPVKFYDFPLLSTMLRAFSPQGDLRDLENPESRREALPGLRSVTFVINHDIPQNPMAHYFFGGSQGESGRHGDPVDERLAHAYIFGRRAGTPYAYSDRGLEGADGVPTDAYKNAHCGESLVRMVKFHNLVLGQPENFVHREPNTLVWTRGSSAFVVIHKANSAGALSGVALAGLEDGTYRDVLSEAVVEVRNGMAPRVEFGSRRPSLFVKDEVARTVEWQQGSCAQEENRIAPTSSQGPPR